MKSYKNLGHRIAIIVMILMGFSGVAQAQSSGYYGGSNAYQFGGTPGSFGSTTAGSTNVFDVSVAGNNSANFLGCGGLGIFNFSQITFNASNMITQLTKNMETMMAKQLLTTAMSIPQVSAIFDTLNAMSHASFSLFNQSCNLSQIKKDARDAVIKKCQQDGGNVTDCTQNWDSQANAGKWLQSALGDLCKFENFNQSARTALCKDDNGNATNNCGMMAFVPQYRLNLAGSAGGSGASATCGGTMSNYGVKPPVFVLQSSVDAIRTVSHVYTNKGMTSIQQARASGVPYTAVKLAIAAAREKCNTDPVNCGGTTTTNSASAAQPGFVQLATVDLKSLGYADSTTDTPDAMENRFRKALNCSTTADPLKLIKATNIELQQQNASWTLGDFSVTASDAQNITNNLNFNVGGDATAGQQLGVDAKSAARLLQIATSCIMANTLPAVDPDQQAKLIYEEDPDCASAAMNGDEIRVAHLAATAMYSFLADEARSGKSAITSSQAQPAGTSTSDTTPDSVKKAQNETMQSVISYLESQVKYENDKYNAIKDKVQFSQTPGACRAAKPAQVIVTDPANDE